MLDTDITSNGICNATDSRCRDHNVVHIGYASEHLWASMETNSHLIFPVEELIELLVGGKMLTFWQILDTDITSSGICNARKFMTIFTCSHTNRQSRKSPATIVGVVKSLVGFLLLLNICMFLVVGAIAGCALNDTLDPTYYTGSGRVLPQGLSPIYFPVGNEATSFMVIFAFIAVVVGAASCLSGLHHLQIWGAQSLASSAASSMTAWALTLLAMGLWKSSSSRVFSNLFSSGE